MSEKEATFSVLLFQRKQDSLIVFLSIAWSNLFECFEAPLNTISALSSGEERPKDTHSGTNINTLLTGEYRRGCEGQQQNYDCGFESCESRLHQSDFSDGEN